MAPRAPAEPTPHLQRARGQDFSDTGIAPTRPGLCARALGGGQIGDRAGGGGLWAEVGRGRAVYNREEGNGARGCGERRLTPSAARPSPWALRRRGACGAAS